MATASLNRRLDELDVRRICVIKPSALGDVVQSLPLLPVLRERFSNATISWVINHEFADLLRIPIFIVMAAMKPPVAAPKST